MTQCEFCGGALYRNMSCSVCGVMFAPPMNTGTELTAEDLVLRMENPPTSRYLIMHPDAYSILTRADVSRVYDRFANGTNASWTISPSTTTVVDLGTSYTLEDVGNLTGWGSVQNDNPTIVWGNTATTGGE